jgi:hypothetical protein
MTPQPPQGNVTRAGYYRHWAASAPRREEVTVRDAIQRLALANLMTGVRTCMPRRSKFRCSVRNTADILRWNRGVGVNVARALRNGRCGDGCASGIFAGTDGVVDTEHYLLGLYSCAGRGPACSYFRGSKVD